MAIPMMIGMLSHILLNIIDGIYVGRLGLQESLAVLNFGFPFFYIIFAVFNGLTSGTTSVLARCIGAGEKEKAENTLSQIVWIGLGLFLLFLAVYPLLLPAYLALQKAPAPSAALTGQYLGALFLGIPFTVLALLWGSGLRAEGNTRTLMNAMMLGTAVNLALAPFLIYGEFRFLGRTWQGMGLSVQGAGLATAAANLLTALVVFLAFARGRTVLRLRFWPRWNDRSGLKEAFAVGLPSILSQSLIGINLAILTRLAAPFGPSAVAAIGMGSRLESLAVFPSLALMIAVLSLVGQNYGARRYDRVERTVKLGLASAFIGLAAIGLLTRLLRGHLLGWFNPDALTLPSALHYTGLLTLGFGFVGISIVSSGAFQGLGRGWPFLLLNFLRLVLVAWPLGLLLSQGWGEGGLHYTPLAASACSGLVASLWILAAVRRLNQAPVPGPAAVVAVT